MSLFFGGKGDNSVCLRTLAGEVSYETLATILRRNSIVETLSRIETSSRGNVTTTVNGRAVTSTTLGKRVGLLFTQTGLASDASAAANEANTAAYIELCTLVVALLSILSSENGDVTVCPVDAGSKVPLPEARKQIVEIFRCDIVLLLESALTGSIGQTFLYELQREGVRVFALRVPRSLDELETTDLAPYEVVDHRISPSACRDEAVPPAARPFSNCEIKLLLATSGTTGEQKLVPYSQQQLLRAGKGIARSLSLTGSDVCLNAMPLFHIGGIACNFLAVLWSGGSVHLVPGFDANVCAHLVLNGSPKPSWYYMVPTMHRAMVLVLSSLNAVESDGVEKRSHNLRFVRSASAALPPEEAARIWECLNRDLASDQKQPCAVLATYGMTEAMPICSPPILNSITDSEAQARGGSVGVPCAGVEVRIAELEESEEGSLAATQPREAPVFREEPGFLGEICVRGENVFPGYIEENLEEMPSSEKAETGKATLTADGWFRTGDLGFLESAPSGSGASQHLRIQGRAREMLKRGGEQVSLYDLDRHVREKFRSFLTSVSLAEDFNNSASCVSLVTFAAPSALYGEEPCVLLSFAGHEGVELLRKLLEMEHRWFMGERNNSTGSDAVAVAGEVLTGASLVLLLNKLGARLAAAQHLNQDLAEHRKVRQIFFYAGVKERNLPQTATGKWQRRKMYDWAIQGTISVIAENEHSLWCPPLRPQSSAASSPPATVGAPVGAPVQAVAGSHPAVFLPKDAKNPLMYCSFDPSNVSRTAIMEGVAQSALVKYCRGLLNLEKSAAPAAEHRADGPAEVLVSSTEDPLIYMHNSASTLVGLAPQDYSDRMLASGCKITVDLSRDTAVAVQRPQVVARTSAAEIAPTDARTQQERLSGGAAVAYQVQYHAFSVQQPNAANYGAPYVEQEIPEEGEVKSTGATPALRAVRFFIACWVIQLHVGRYPTEFLAKMQSLSMDMAAFTFLAAFLMAKATANSTGIRREARRKFFITRIGMAHSLYLLSLLFAIPVFLLRCGPGQCGLLPHNSKKVDHRTPQSSDSNKGSLLRGKDSIPKAPDDGDTVSESGLASSAPERTLNERLEDFQPCSELVKAGLTYADYIFAREDDASRKLTMRAEERLDHQDVATYSKHSGEITEKKRTDDGGSAAQNEMKDENPPQGSKPKERTAVYYLEVAIRFLVMSSGFISAIFAGPVNPVCWYQANYYFFLLLYPWYDTFVRDQTTRKTFLPLAEGPEARGGSSGPGSGNVRFFRRDFLPGQTLCGSCGFGCLATVSMFLLIPLGPFLLLANFLHFSWVPLFLAGMFFWRVHDKMFLPRILSCTVQDEETTPLQDSNYVEMGEMAANTRTTVPNSTTVIGSSTRNDASIREARDLHRAAPSCVSLVLTSPVLWAFLTDLLSVFFLFLFYVNYLDECALRDDGKGEECRPHGTWEQYDKEANLHIKNRGPEGSHAVWKDGRWNTRFSVLWGFLRLHTPFLIVWLLGLAGIGYRSFTYKFLSQPFLVDTLAPLAYPMYLLHYNVAWLYWMLTRGLSENREWNEEGWWYDHAAAYPFPIAWWELLLVIFVTVCAAAVVNFLSPKFVRAGQACISCQVGCASLVMSPCCDPCPAEDEHEESNSHDGTGREALLASMLSPHGANERSVTPSGQSQNAQSMSTSTTFPRLSKLVREMSGAVVSSNSRIEELGLDSFGLPAFVGALRTRFPGVRIELRDVVRLRTVGEIVAYLDRQREGVLQE